MPERPFEVLTMRQRSPEWLAARCGRLTGSVAGDMLATIKTGEAAARRDLRTKLVVERLTGQSQDDGYVNAVMQRGIYCEPLARRAYEARTGLLVRETGFLSHVSLMAGASLDGHVGDFAGLVSFKCPKSSTHFRYLRAGNLPAEYIGQALHELWMVPSAQFYDFVSFDDRFPADLQVFLVRAVRSDLAVALQEYERKALAFLEEVDLEHRAALGLRAA